jgi:anti-anti-sigma regulatory factor
MTLKIDRSDRGELAVFTLIGRIEGEHIAELKQLFEVQAGYPNIILNLQQVRLAGRDAVSFLARCEDEGMKLEDCPAYIREWMEREKE